MAAAVISDEMVTAYTPSRPALWLPSQKATSLEVTSVLSADVTVSSRVIDTLHRTANYRQILEAQDGNPTN